MAKIINVLKEEMPALTLVCKVYHDNDRGGNGTFSAKWGEWFEKGYFDQIEKCGTPYDGSYVGAMRMNGKEFEYCIGILMQGAYKLPDGFDGVEIAACSMGVVWVKGKDDATLYSMHEKSLEALAKNGMTPAENAWYIERYACPRFTAPDENGEVILDYMVTVG